jgi:putative ABC transport system substrate-binding protein
LAAAPLLAPAQRAFRVGILGNGTKDENAAYWSVTLDRLRELGYAEGRNLVIESRWGEGELARLPGLAVELVATGPDVIVAISTPGARAAMAATATIPIVFPAAADPVGAGLVKSLARPGGNVTGQSILVADTAAKRIELTLLVVPKARRLGLIGPASNPGVAAVYRQLQDAARERKLDLQQFDANDADAIERAFVQMRAASVDGLIVAAILVRHREQLAGLAVRHRLPVIYVFPEHLDAGGLITFGPDLRSLYRRTADSVHRILRGAKPGDMPVEQARVVLGVNLKAARAIGVTIPQALLARADRVIE